MKETIKNLYKWIIIWVGFMIVVWSSYILIKARSDTKSTTDTDPNSLYVNAWDTLTATKRNTIADRSRVYDSGRFNVWTTAGAGWASTDSYRNYYKITHNLNTDNITIQVLWDNWSDQYYSVIPYYQWLNYWQWRDCSWYVTKKIDNNSFYIMTRYASSSWHAFYLGIWNTFGTSGKYRVIVRTF